MSFIKKIIKYLIIIGLIVGLIGAIIAYFIYKDLNSKLPDVSQLSEIQLQEPLRVYTNDGLLISEYGEKRRIPLTIEETPKLLKQAFLASEDDRFYEHPGVDWQGIARAGYVWITTGDRSQGGSTITMQVARNFFLTPDKTIKRKVDEMLLALKMTQELSKDEVLQLYLNKIYLGKRAYGVAAAAKIYYNKQVEELTLAQMAMIAGLPKAPSRYNPIANPERALTRRNYVLRRMLELNMIDQATHDLAKTEAISAQVYVTTPDVKAHYIGEMARAKVEELFPESVYDSGIKVFTTIDSIQQRAANTATRNGLLTIDRRHGYRGVISSHADLFSGQNEFDQTRADQLLADTPPKMSLSPAIVFDMNDTTMRMYLGNGTTGDIPFETFKWAKKYINEDKQGPDLKSPSAVFKKGDLVWIDLDAKGQLALAQIPKQETALVALNTNTGAITALVGGKDYFLSKFNRATQAERQAGSSFKPFLYSAAIDSNYTASTVINDAPVVFNQNTFAGKWKPENYSSKSYGPTRLRTALAFSRNLVSIRLLMDMEVENALNYAVSIGFDRNKLPNDLSLSLGSGSITPVDLASKFALFANGGYQIKPFFIDRIETNKGEILYQQPRQVACLSCWKKQQKDAPKKPNLIIRSDADNQAFVSQAKHVMRSSTAFIMRSILSDVTSIGTGRKARELKRTDIGGKTGTTNDQVDAWFSGFNSDLVATVWVGQDDSKPMGFEETGTSAASPIWVEFMKTAMANMPNNPPKQPRNVVSLSIDPETGFLAYPNQDNAKKEYFRVGNTPTEQAIPSDNQLGSGLERDDESLNDDETINNLPTGNLF